MHPAAQLAYDVQLIILAVYALHFLFWALKAWWEWWQERRNEIWKRYRYDLDQQLKTGDPWDQRSWPWRRRKR